MLTVETFIDEAVVLIRAVATVVITVTQQCLVHTLAIGAQEGSVITVPLYGEKQNNNL